MGEPVFMFKVNPLFLLVIFIFIIAGSGDQLLVAFILVFLHEMIHLLVASACGYQIYKIELFPFGGMAEYRGLLEMDPISEAEVAAAGPIFNLLLTLFFYLFGEKIDFLTIKYLNLLIKYNMIIALFNLIPALPLDGGRILRSFFVARMGFGRGTMLSIKISRLFALVGAIIGVLSFAFQQTNIWILFISFFVYGAAVKEKKKIIYYLLSYLTRRKEFVADLQIKPVYLQAIKSNLYIKDILITIIPGKFNLFYLADKNKFVSEIELLDSLFSIEDREVKVGELI